MEGPLDPFRERLPDFDDERLNAVARVIEHGRETADALAGMGSIEERSSELSERWTTFRRKRRSS